MGGRENLGPMVIETDGENEDLDITIPILRPKISRNYKNLEELDVDTLQFTPQKLVSYSDDKIREIVFREITDGDVSHITELDREFNVDVNMLIRYFTKSIFRDLRLFGGQDIIYGKIKSFIESRLFGTVVDINDRNVLRNLSEPYINNEIKESFKKAINHLSLTEDGETVVIDELRVGNTRPFLVKNSNYLKPKKSLFNKIIGDSDFELEFASFLDKSTDVKSFVKCFKEVGFKIDYINSDGNPSVYYPDFVVRLNDDSYVVIETKGDVYVDDDVKLKNERLKRWCEDSSKLTGQKWSSLYILQSKWNGLSETPTSFNTLSQIFSY